MAIRKDFSKWRDSRYSAYGEAVVGDIVTTFGSRKFQIKDVGALAVLDHLSPSTAYDTATAICSYLEHSKKITRLGRFFRLNIEKPKEEKVNEITTKSRAKKSRYSKFKKNN